MFKCFCPCVRQSSQEIEPQFSVTKAQPTTQERSLFKQDASGQIGIGEGFWELCQSEEGSSRTIGDAFISEDLIDIGREAWEPIKQLVESNPLKIKAPIFKKALSVVVSVETTEILLKMGEAIPWIGLVAKLGSIIYLGVQDVYSNLENCQKLGEFIKTIMITISQAPEEKLQMFHEATEFVNQNATEGFEKYMSLGISVIARFTRRRNLMAFLMHSQDAQDFEHVQKGLSQTMILINFQMNMIQPQKFVNEYSKVRKEVEDLITKLGNGDVNRGLQMLSDSLTPQNNGSDDKDTRVLLDKVKKALDQIPENSQPQIVISTEESVDLNKLFATKLPLQLSLQLKSFWWNKFGNQEFVEWSLIETELEDGFKTFLNSNEVRERENECQFGEKGLLQYIFKNMLDLNQDGKVSGAELRVLYTWCIKQWQHEESVEGGYPPRSIGDLLRTLHRHMPEAEKEIQKRRTLDLSDKRIVADTVGLNIFEKNSKKLPLIISMNVSRNPIGDKGARTIFKNKDAMPKLEELTMEECKLGDKLEGIQYLIPQLKKLKLGSNQIGDKGVYYITEGLRQGTVELEELDLEDNEITDEGALLIKNSLQTDNCIIKELNLCQNKLSEDAVEQLGELTDTIDITLLVDQDV
eukprot:TRINITY_DN23298_c0_g1_i1.p1 TRINITY_DN23298_c0_g1~~TRINITY_DN23298_c0_g1_i1.p1  ORF type:complete len:694 (+),score=104.29 TRINITY_DN23298_c0_g1_i1:173-2083(+)